MSVKQSQDGYAPTHADFYVEFNQGEFSSFLRTRKAFSTGETLVELENLTKAPRKYTTVQCGPGVNDHVELNSDFVYVNHSCEPNVAFDLSSSEISNWHIRALKPIAAGEPLTFFYPSTEWDMDQAFACQCGAPTCLGRIQGAKYLTIEELNARLWVNPWIVELVAQRDAAAKKNDKA